MIEVAAIILAAGRGTRFGAGEASKLVALWQGKPLVRWVAEAALASRATATLVVTGHAAPLIQAALEPLAVTLVHNRDYASGMASSLQAALPALPTSARGVVILLADMPMITAAIIDTLIARFDEEGDADAVIPVFEGKSGNPVLLGRAMFPALAGLSGDQGARRLLATPGRKVLSCPVSDRAVAVDVDTAAILADMHRRS